MEANPLWIRPCRPGVIGGNCELECPNGYVTYSKLHQMVSKDLFLRVHHITSYWRVLVLDWIRQLLRAHAPFDVTRRLHYEFDVFPDHTSRWRWTLAPGSQYGYWRIINFL